MVLRKTLRPQGTGVYVAMGVRAHLNPDDREGSGGVLSLFLRLFARVRWTVLVGLSVVVRPGTAQELDLRPLPLPQGEFLTNPSSLPRHRQTPRKKRIHGRRVLMRTFKKALPTIEFSGPFRIS